MKTTIITAITIALALLSASSFGQEVRLQELLDTDEKRTFWKESGWTFTDTVKEGVEAMQWSDLQQVSGAKAPDANTFDPESFDPERYLIPLRHNETLVIIVPGKGMISFYSADRFSALYERQKANQK